MAIRHDYQGKARVLCYADRMPRRVSIGDEIEAGTITGMNAPQAPDAPGCVFIGPQEFEPAQLGMVWIEAD